MAKEVYIAARAKYRAKEVAEIQNTLQEMGYEIAYDWLSVSIKKPYRSPKNRLHNLKAQEKMLKAAADADILIFMDEPEIRGAYIELGAFLLSCLYNSAGRFAYIVGEHSHEREFIFESPDYVLFKDTIEEVYEDLKKNG